MLAIIITIVFYAPIIIDLLTSKKYNPQDRENDHTFDRRDTY